MENKKNKKIAFFIPSLRGGGAERMMCHLAESFAKQKETEVHLIVAENQGVYDLPQNVSLFCFNVKKLKYSLFPLIRYLKKEEPEVLISTLDHVNIISVFAKVLSFSNVKIIVRVASTLSFSLQGTKWHKRWIRKYGAMIFYRFADTIVANSKGSADDLAKTLKISRDKINVIYNPTVTSDIAIKVQEPVNHNWINDKDIFLFLGTGRLTKAKDFKTLINALAKTKEILRQIQNDNIKDIKLIILGEGEERKHLEELIKELGMENDIDMPGFVNNPYAYMAKADLFVLSSKWEGLPNVLIEAMACGTPVISTDCPSGPSEILENGKYGELFSVGDSKALAEKINYVLTLPEEKKKRIIEKARKSVEERFSVEKIVGEYEKLYEELVKD
jgi:glycosyltransferase involved in cell wall biosynthesis